MPEHARIESLLLRLRWLGRLRWYGAAALAGLGLVVHFAAGLTINWRTLLVLAGVIGVYNLLFQGLLRHLGVDRRRMLTFEKLEQFADLQIGLDLVLLTLALHFSGGLENPFIILYVCHPIIASILLTPRSAYMQAALATLLLLAMGVCEAVWPSLHYPVGGYLPDMFFANPLLITGEVIALAVTIHVSVYLGSSIAERLHRRERQLREARDALEKHSEELAGANLKLQALEERKSRFLSLAAHQLRGPLAATEGCLVVACDGYTSDPAKQEELINRARIRIQGMLQIVRDLLTLARTHELAEPARRALVDLDAVAGHVAEQYTGFAASRQIDLVFYPGSHGATVLGDERALVDAIGNLVSNAIKYTGEGGHVKVATRTAHAEAVCEVIDDGIGIPDGEKDQLFKEFFRASNACSTGQEGTGLGLSIVREIVSKHGGRLTIESLENLGTCALISLPLAAPQPQAVPTHHGSSGSS